MLSAFNLSFTKLIGGKFENGAVTAAFDRLFNDEIPTHQAQKGDGVMGYDLI